jgi:peptidoglycan/LPS O-acetylase OafA/YrhL
VNKPSLKHIPEIDGLRALAILFVLIWHYFNNLLQASSNSLAKYFVLMTNQTWSGVDLFFVISGFLITGILLKNKGSKNYFKAFYIRRFFRIFPIYYLMVFLFAGIGWFQIDIGSYLMDNNSIPLWSYFIHIQNFFMATQNSFGSHFLGVSWSLAIEEQFYLVLPLFIWIVPKNFLRFLLPSLIFLGLIFRLQTSGYTQLLLLPSRLDGLMVGAAIAWFYRYNFIKLNGINSSLLWTVLLLMLALAIGAKVFQIHIPGGTIFPISISYGIVLILALKEEDSILKRFLRNKLLSKVSKVSYGMYLYHIVVLGLIFKFLRGSSPQLQNTTDFMYVALALVATYIVSVISFRFLKNL